MESTQQELPAILSGSFAATGGAMHAYGAYPPYCPADSSGMASDSFQSTCQSLEPSDKSWNPKLQMKLH